MSRAARVGAPTMAAVLYVLLMVPPEVSVSLGGLRLSPYRILLLTATPLLVWQLLGGRFGRMLAADLLVMAHALWVLLALVVYEGLVGGIESGGVYAVESLGAYLVGRSAVRSAETSRATYRFMLLALGGMLLFTLPESLTGAHVLRDVARAIFGGPSLVPIDPRLGLDRAYGSFDHPILYGVFAGSMLAAAYYVLAEEKLGARQISVLGFVAFSTFLSLSAGPFVGLAAQLGVIGWDRITRGLQGRWWLLAAGAVLFFVALSLGSNRSPMKVLISYLSFSSVSSYNRILIWEYGTAEVARHPMFGIGFGDWIRAPWMSDSMDNFWLLTAVRYGLPAVCFLFAALLAIAISQHGACTGDRVRNRHRMAWATVMTGFFICGTTVHFWNALFTYFFFLVGCGAWLCQAPVRRRLPLRRPRSLPQPALA